MRSFELRIAVNFFTAGVKALTASESVNSLIQQKAKWFGWVATVFQKAETSEPVRLISVDAIFSGTLKRLCVYDCVSKRFDQVRCPSGLMTLTMDVAHTLFLQR